MKGIYMEEIEKIPLEKYLNNDEINIDELKI